jgi:uncharacterized GH25 family protein
MKRLLISLVLLALPTAAGRAHFIWVVPDKGAATAQVLFSEDLTPDSPDLLGKVAQTQWYARDNAGKTTAIKWTKAKEGYSLAAPAKGPTLLGGVCLYGVLQRGKDQPFLLKYYAMALVGASPENRPGEVVYAPWDVLPMQILPAKGTARGFVVLFEGKPLADAEVVVQPQGKEKAQTLKTDAKGIVELPGTPNGRWALRVRHVEKKSGEQDGKAYKEIRHYVTRVVNMPSLRPVGPGEKK